MTPPVLVLDFETYWADDYQLRRMTMQEYILDPRFKVHGAGVSALNSPYPIWLKGDKLDEFIKRMVPKCILVGHNLKFDGSILAWRYGVTPVKYHDTLAMSRALIGAAIKSHSLGKIGEALGEEGKQDFLAISKNKRDLDERTELIVRKGCIHDVAMTLKRYNEFLPLMPPAEIDIVDWSVRIFTQPTLVLNTERLGVYYNKVMDDKDSALQRAGLESRDVLMSNPRFAQALEAFGVIPPTKISPATGKETFAFAKTDEDMQALLEHDNPDVQALVAARLKHKSTIEETRAAAYWRASQLGPWPVDLNYSGADHTHRMSGAGGGGGNPQNMKRGGELRNCIEAPPGFVIVTGDLSQVELRVTMGYAGENEPLERMANGEDLYAWFASLMYGYPVTKATHPYERQVAKSAVLGLGFGMGWKTFYKYCRAQGIKITEDEAKRAVDLYRSVFSRVPRLWLQCDRLLRAMFFDQEEAFPVAKPILMTQEPPYKIGSCGIRLPSGLHVKYNALRRMGSGAWAYNRKGASLSIFGSEIVANIVQATAADILKEKLAILMKICPVPLAVHDELVCLFPKDKADIGKQIVQKVMSKSPSFWPELPLDTEVKAGKTYGSTK